jgi:tetratricopeptide (TPR) repeat protein
MARGKKARLKNREAGAAVVSSESVRVVYPPWPGWARIAMAAILLVAVIAFGGAIDAPFQFDDVASIPQNPTISRISAEALSPPAGGLAVSGRPIANLSFAFNHAIDAARGVNGTVSYHVVNLLLHLLCGLVIFGIVRRTILLGRHLSDWTENADAIAVAVTTLWLLHPIQTDAVDYVVQRTELLVSLFYAATLYASIRAWDASARGRRFGWFALSTACCLLGMGSKEVMVSAPLIVILYDRAFRTDSWKALVSGPAVRRWFYAALICTMLWLAVLVGGGARSTTAGFETGLPWYRYLYTQAWAIGRYLRLLIVPSGLIYDYGQEPVAGLAGVPGLLVLAALGAATIVAWTRDRWRWFGFAGAWFFLLLGPSSSVVPIRTEIAAERRIYLASASIVVMIVVGIVALLRRQRRTSPARAREWTVAGRAALVAVAGVFAIATFQRSRLYRSPEGLWRDTIARRPTNPRAYDNLAAVLLQKDSTHRAEAEQLFRRAIAVDSTYLPAWTNLADVEIRAGRTAEARALLEHVLRIAPQYVDATARLGAVLAKDGDLTQSIPMLERAAAAAPTDELYVTLATAYIQSGRADDAMAALRHALELNPARADAAGYVGVQLAENGHPDQAVPYLETASRAPTAQPIVLALLSLSYAQLGNVNQALATANVAETRAGKDERLYLTLGRAMLLVNRVADAARLFAEGVRLAPEDPEAITRLGIAKAAGGDSAAAERLFRRALSLTPDYGPAVQALAQLRSSR